MVCSVRCEIVCCKAWLKGDAGGDRGVDHGRGGRSAGWQARRHVYWEAGRVPTPYTGAMDAAPPRRPTELAAGSPAGLRSALSRDNRRDTSRPGQWRVHLSG